MKPSEIEEKYTLRAYPKLPFALVRGEGCHVTDDSGRQYLDLYGGHAVSCLGHSHPRWVEAITEQLKTLDFYSNICYHPARAEASELLVRNSYPSMSGVYFCNSGAEANETALKMARKATGRPLVIAMNDCFHGRTIGALSVTGMPKMRDAFPQNIADRTRFIDLGDLDAVRALPPDDIAAVILEPVQSLAGVRLAGVDYYRKLREHCSRHGILLIFDEVQTGSGRTGKWFVGRHWDVEPDLVTTAKGVAGGFPVGVVIAGDRVARDVQTGDQGSTFGGGPLAAAAVAATYRIILEENLVEAVARRSAEVVDRLQDMVRRERIREVRGLGYLLGVECTGPAKEVQGRLRAEGILVGGSYHPATFRLLPPYTVEDSHWERFFEVFERVCA